jgi:endonuclease YncB( thermonuclease family)
MHSLTETLSTLVNDHREKVDKYKPVFRNNVVKVFDHYDGDTFHCVGLLDVPVVPYKFTVRINGIDTPEIKTKDVNEHEKALVAKKALQDFIPKNSIIGLNLMVKDGPIGYDKYGRILATPYMFKGNESVNVSKYMLDNGYAKEYHGGHKDKWIDEEIV